MIDKTIPAAYDQLEYILSDGTQYINTEYIPLATSNIECEFEAVLNTNRNYEALFGARTATFNTCFLFFTRFAGNNIPCFSSGNVETEGSDMHYDEKLKLTVVDNTASWYDMNGDLISSITSAPRVNCTQPLFIFDLNNGGGRDGSFCRAKIYSFKITENNVIKRWLIPVAKHDNPTICGLYDIVTDTFLQKGEGNNFTAGSVVEKNVFSVPYNEGLFSRIFVAGGGGAAPFEYNNTNYQYFTTFGGGPLSGWITGRGDASNKLYIYAAQTSGYSFGIGANAEDRKLSSSVASWGAEGQGGGGGGWYGGHAARGLRSPNTADTACGGAGGSSYILTESSYKPAYYMINFIDIMPSLYFRDGLMLPYQAFDGPSIVIYKAATKPPLVGDTVIIPYTGVEQSMMLHAGEYKIKCYGGDGATRFRVDLASKGGYAEGVLKLQTDQPLYYHVGSSCLLIGMNADAALHDSIYNNRMSYHATIGSYSNHLLGAMSGGGSTDVSTETEVDNTSRYRLSRFIVAGGGGGQGSSGRNGGNGGGLEGGSYTGDGYGTNNGPGKQSSGYAFGYGELGKNQSGGYGGSGGSGWYGGCGTTPDGSIDDDKGGCGGSGYVLTESSYKPSGYIPDESFWLSDTVLTTGGNPVRGMTKIVIEPLNVEVVYILAHDNSGYKAYNTTIDEWYPISISELTTEVFEAYGITSIKIKSDTGLEFPYKYYAFDLVNMGIDSIKTHVTPETLHVTFSKRTVDEIIGENYDFEADTNVDINTEYTISGVAEFRAVNVDMTFDMNDIPSRNSTYYAIQFQVHRKPESYYYPTPPEKTIEKLDLLPVGQRTTIPSRYKPSIGGFMPDGTTAITTVNCSSACEYKRNIYIATLINGTHLRFTRFSIMDNTAYTIRDVPIAGLLAYSTKACGGSLLVDDENMYLYHSYIKEGSSTWWYARVLIVPLDPSKECINYATGSDSTWSNNAFGQAYWYSSYQIISTSLRGYLLFNTKTKTFTTHADSDGSNIERNSWALGDYTCLEYSNSDSTTSPRMHIRSTLARIADKEAALTTPAGKKAVCFGDGKFYIIQKAHLYIVEDKPDNNLTIDQDITAPFSSIQPKHIVYSKGVLYITFENQSSLYSYNLKTGQWIFSPLPFNTGAINSTAVSAWYRPAVYNGYYFIEHLKMYTTNALQPFKYRMGEKDGFISIRTNSSIEPTMTYDDKFFTVDSNGINFHTGYITKEFTEIDNVNHIYESEPYQLHEYRKFIDCKIIMRERRNDNG